MKFSAAQISSLIDGKIEGDAETSVGSFEKIEEAQRGQLAFLGNPKYEEYLYTTKASIVIIDEGQILKQPVDACLIRVPNAYSAFAILLTKYQEMTLLQMTGVESPSFVHDTATLGENIYIGAFAYLGENVQIGNKTKIFPHVFLGKNVHIGENTIIHPGVIIYNDCVIKNHVTIHAGTVIGSDGFGFAPQNDTSYKKVPQIGNVIVEDNVEIGANTTIDRATIGSTIIRRGVKLDNLIQVAHNVEIGSNTVVAAQVGISGSTKVGENVMIGGQAGLAGHIQIANGCKINGQSGVSKSIRTPNVAITGTNAYDYASAMKSQAISRNLPEMEKRLRRVEMLLDKLA